MTLRWVMSLRPWAWCRLFPGLVGLQLLNESQIQWSSAGSGTENRHARSLKNFGKNCPSCSISGPPPNARRPSRVSPCQKSAVRCPTPKLVSCLKSVTIFKNLEELARGAARVQGRPAGGLRNQRRKRAHCLCRPPHGWFLVNDTAACACWSIMCRVGKSEDSLLKRRAVRSFAPLLENSSTLYRSARFLWSNTSKSTVIPTISLFRKSSITSVHSFLLQ